MDGSDDMRQLYPREAGFMKASQYAGRGLKEKRGSSQEKPLFCSPIKNYLRMDRTKRLTYACDSNVEA